MTQPPRTPDDRWRDLMDGLADSAAEAPDADVVEEAREAHGDETRRAEEIRASMLATIDAHRAGERDGRVLPFVAARPRERAPERSGAWWRLTAAAAAVVVVSSLGLVAFRHAGSTEVASTPAVVETPPAQPSTPPVVPGPSSDPAPPSNPNANGHTTATGFDGSAGAPAARLPRTERRKSEHPVMPGDIVWIRQKTPDTRSVPEAHVALAAVKTVFVDLKAVSPSAVALHLREEVVRRIEAGGVVAPVDDPKADARLRITEGTNGRFSFLFIAESKEVWKAAGLAGRPADAATSAENIAQAVTSTVVEARQQVGASQ